MTWKEKAMEQVWNGFKRRFVRVAWLRYCGMTETEAEQFIDKYFPNETKERIVDQAFSEHRPTLSGRVRRRRGSFRSPTKAMGSSRGTGRTVPR